MTGLKNVMQYARKQQSVVSTFVDEHMVPSALSVDFICTSCQTATIYTYKYIHIKVQPQVRRAAEPWLLPQESEDPGPCPSESTILNGSNLWKEFTSVENYSEFLVSAHRRLKLCWAQGIDKQKL
jgi:hypothetical protein